MVGMTRVTQSMHTILLHMEDREMQFRFRALSVPLRYATFHASIRHALACRRPEGSVHDRNRPPQGQERCRPDRNGLGFEEAPGDRRFIQAALSPVHVKRASAETGPDSKSQHKERQRARLVGVFLWPAMRG